MRTLLLLLSGAVTLAQGTFIGGGAVIAGGVSVGTGSASGATFVQACTPVNDFSNETSQAISCTGVTAGHALVLPFVLGSTGSAPAVTDGASSSWTCSATVGSGGGGAIAYVCYTLNELGSGSVTATLTWTTATYVMAFLDEISGVTSFDQAAGGDTGSATTAWVWPAITTTASGITMAVGGNGFSAVAFTPGTGYTLPANNAVNGGGQSALAEYKLTTAASQTPAATAGSAIVGTLLSFSFK